MHSLLLGLLLVNLKGEWVWSGRHISFVISCYAPQRSLQANSQQSHSHSIQFISKPTAIRLWELINCIANAFVKISRKIQKNAEFYLAHTPFLCRFKSYYTCCNEELIGKLTCTIVWSGYFWKCGHGLFRNWIKCVVHTWSSVTSKHYGTISFHQAKQPLKTTFLKKLWTCRLWWFSNDIMLNPTMIPSTWLYIKCPHFLSRLGTMKSLGLGS